MNRTKDVIEYLEDAFHGLDGIAVDISNSTMTFSYIVRVRVQQKYVAIQFDAMEDTQGILDMCNELIDKVHQVYEEQVSPETPVVPGPWTSKGA